MPPEDPQITYTPVPCICSGVITSVINKTETYEVSIYSSPLGELNGPIYASLITQPGQDGNYKRGDYVRVMVCFAFGGPDRKFMDVYPGGANHILGTFTERSISNIKVDNPLSRQDGDRVRFVNRVSGAGLVATDSGKLVLAAGGAIYSMLSPFGSGIHEHSHRTMVQNHQRLIAYNAPFYLAREHFGMYAGADQDDKMTRATGEDYPITFRRFVTQTKDPSNWVSTCEGAWCPWVGANNDYEEVDFVREVIFTKIINYDTSRVTVEVGEPGDSFVTLRVDDVVTSEKNLPISPGATPAIVGNRFKLAISDKGEVDLRAGGQAIPGANFNGLHLSFDEKGGLRIDVKGLITLSHGDADDTNNSLVLDPDKGIDIIAKNGFRINGQEAVLKAFLDWLQQNQAQLCQTTSPGGPAPIHPLALPTFTSGMQKLSEQEGFYSQNKGASATGIIKDADVHQSV